MKKLILVLVALIGLTAFSQNIQNITKQTVIVDSIKYNQDSIPRVHFKIVRIIQDTLFNMSSTPSELTNSLKIANDRVRFTDQSVKAQIIYLRDSIKDQQAKQYVAQQIYSQNNSAIQYRSEHEMLKKIKAKFIEIKVIK